jgi:hypothetical protein
MAFDQKLFMKTKFTAREEAVPVPELKVFFGDEPAEWLVRGLTGVELGQANEAAEKNKSISAMIEGLMSSNKKETVEAVKKLIGTGQTPQDVAKRIEMFIFGSVNPVADIELALKLCENYPVEFIQLTNKITQLTGKGRIPGKLQGSGVIPPSEPN